MLRSIGGITMVLDKNKFVNQIKQAKEIYIMGHMDLDLDALGSAIGIQISLKQMRKSSSIIIEERQSELAVSETLMNTRDEITVIKKDKVEIQDDNLLIIVDTNKKAMTQCPDLVDKFKNIIIIDHHQITENSIKNGMRWIDEHASSTCEMLTTLLEELEITLPASINTLILSGIVLDTNNFVVKTDKETYYAAYLLTKRGASPTDVQYLLKQDIEKYIARQKAITNVEICGNVAITKGEENICYRREDLAKIADTLLQFKGIEASFMIGKLNENVIGISARSMGTFPMVEIVQSLGGGGDSHEAAAKVEGKTLKEIEEKIKTMIQNKEE